MQFQLLQVSSGGKDAQGPLVYLSGRSAAGRSVVAVVQGSCPYLCIKLEHGLLHPKTSAPNTRIIDLLLRELNTHLNRTVPRWGKYACFHKSRDGSDLVRKSEVVFVRDYYGYSPEKHPYLKVHFGSASALTSARFSLLALAGNKERTALTSAENLQLLFPNAPAEAIRRCLTDAPRAPYDTFAFTLAEANIEHHNQFCADRGVNPGRWVTVRDVKLWEPSCKLTKAQHELHVRVNDVKPADVDGSAPIRVLSFDLETFCTDLGNGATRFYDGNDPRAKILCISAVAFDYTSKQIAGRVFSLGNAAGAEELRTSNGADAFTVEWFTTETEMIRAFIEHLKRYDPDIVTGWNTVGSAKAFDWMFLYKRCLVLDTGRPGSLLDALKSTGRWGQTKFHVDEKTGLWSERARIPIVMPGRIVHDMMLWTKRNKNLREYNLNFVAEAFKCGEKDDVSYNQIDGLSRTHEGRKKLAVYCELDSRLVCKLMLCNELDPIGKTVALSAITGCPLEDLIFKGSMNSLRLCLLRVSHRNGFVLSCPSYAEADAADEPTETVEVVDDGGDPVARYQVRC